MVKLVCMVLLAVAFASTEFIQKRPVLVTKCTQSNQLDCDVAEECTWCKSDAVPSSCILTENAKRLPPSVFDCDKLHSSEHTIDCNADDQESCNAMDDCTWCNSVAYPYTCLPVEIANNLPADETECDKLN